MYVKLKQSIGEGSKQGFIGFDSLPQTCKKMNAGVVKLDKLNPIMATYLTA